MTDDHSRDREGMRSPLYQSIDGDKNNINSKVTIERNLLEKMKISYSAQLFIETSFPTESSQQSTQESEQLLADSPILASGTFIASGDMLGNADEANGVVEELKRALAPKGGSNDPEHLAEIWSLGEPWLNERELNELWPAFVAKLPGQPPSIKLSRGGYAQGEGSQQNVEDC